MAWTTKSFNNLLQWRKVVWPLRSIRMYPPQFVIRDPIIQAVQKSFNQGHEVAVIVFNISNMKDIYEQLSEMQYIDFIKEMKMSFQQVIQEQIEDDDLLLLHDYNSDGVTLFIKVDHEQHCISEIDQVMKKVLRNTENRICDQFPCLFIQFESGYMFVEKKQYSIQEAILKAGQQALAMAEKRVQSEFNELLYSLSRIVAQKNILLLAQPIFDVATKEIRAWEMLTRGPKGTEYENPLHLFSVARQTGMLYDLELIVLEKALQQINDTGCTHDIFINFTPITVGNQKFIRDLKKLMGKYKNISPTQITIEITERDSIDGMEYFIFNINLLRNLGFRIAVDDTGAGYASLNTISEIMPDIIKIDRSVIQDIDKNSVKESMLKGLLLVAREAGSLVVAEGIESEEEASVLSRNRVDLAQGYLFARPASLIHGLASV
ncbi:EAL domain-containing protein [Robertmurraya sp. FSL R5-0851]|uniref:EAL domain-containing protein n=1 Tax=Robertmurraya sp. FSL R5-0851 TaxID=2921584 RepID=UPI00092AB2DF|nr:PAS domain S-box/diguanylate cyclase (GGDEF) domain-containing protein [Mycobacteroides abscessus subsp. abscessus]